ncbi:MAG: hypothetical protein K8F93_02585 [Burkholderiales bacterium]|nr:hypothetical protein [Burkholderiales bacterium]MBZ0248519.1 hypothetical protein [Burkholderiales bacterium]
MEIAGEARVTAGIARLAGAVLAISIGTACATPERPEVSAAEAAEIAALEQAFWYCDYAATTEGVLATPMAACQHATNELKARKFGGSFRAMTAWWQQRKQAEHERLGREAARSRPPRPGLPNPAAS